MAKKSNKTEHVLSLITKGDEQPEIENADTAAMAQQEPEVDILINDSQEKELRIERKLTVEIEPDVLIKPSEKEEKPTVKAPEIKAGNKEDKRAYLINLTERLVTEMVDDVMEKTNVCTCAVCKNDVLALALNSLTQHYVTSDAGKQYIQLDIYKKQHETDVLAALIKACVRVKASPKH
ncbi:MAG: late competence development ComFB family protein [Eubacteriales bacterium]|jgi:competence protein ComFB|nr:late competence development ComFB family protein [Eubacteriales bacterium]